MTMIAEYLLRVPNKLLDELGVGLVLFIKGKILHLWSAIKERDKVRELYRRAGM
jgi:hypothetical protein